MKSLLQQFNKKAAVLLFFIFFQIFCFLTVNAQTVVIKYITPRHSPWQNLADTVFYIISQPGGVCGQPELIDASGTDQQDGRGLLAMAKFSNAAKRFRAEAGKTLDITVEFHYSKFLVQTPRYHGSQETIKAGSEIEQQTFFNGAKVIQDWKESGNVFTKKYSVTYTKGSYLGYVRLPYETFLWQYPGQGDLFISIKPILIPTIVSGQLDEPVAILGKAIQPMVPYMILHAPPGDGSSAETAETKTSCREFSTTLETESVHNADVAVKIGIAGSAGLFVTTDFEFSVTFSAKLTAGDLAIKSNANQTCVTMTKGFSTGAMIGLKGSGDVFMGYGTDLDYGIYRIIRQDAKTCLTSLDSGLVYAPSNNARTFFMTEEQLLEDIAYQRSLSARTDTTVKARNLAANQADVWEKILAMNQANKDNPNNALINNITFGKGVTLTDESGISVVNTNTLDVQNYLEASVGISALVEVAGSGVSGGYEYTNKHRYGNTTTNSQETQKMVKYTLTDDDAGDKFDVKIVRDPMFGTPVFRLESSSKSSCPYQGGYQRDQPKLVHDGTANVHIINQGNPVGSSATFKLDICNESNEPRDYFLKLNATSNLNGAVVSASGVPLNGNDQGQKYSVPANNCLQDLIIEVKQLSASSPLSYPNLELFLYSECEPDIQSSVFASVYFGNASKVDDQNYNHLINVFPNPTPDVLNLVLAEGKQLESIKLMQLSGKLIEGLELKTSANQIQLDLSNLPKAMYLLHAQVDGKIIVKKVSVN